MPNLESLEAQVAQHAKTLDDLTSDVRDLRNGQHSSALDLVRIQGTLATLAVDVKTLGADFKTNQKELLEDQEVRRREEYQELKETLHGRTITFRERVLYIFIPLVVALIGAAVLTWSVLR